MRLALLEFCDHRPEEAAKHLARLQDETLRPAVPREWLRDPEALSKVAESTRHGAAAIPLAPKGR